MITVTTNLSQILALLTTVDAEHSSTCHERTPSGPGKGVCTGGRSSEGRVGGAKCNTPCTTTFITTSDIHTEYNVMHCHVCYSY